MNSPRSTDSQLYNGNVSVSTKASRLNTVSHRKLQRPSVLVVNFPQLRMHVFVKGEVTDVAKWDPGQFCEHYSIFVVTMKQPKFKALRGGSLNRRTKCTEDQSASKRVETNIMALK